MEAREAGLVRFIGVTGHGTSTAAMHRLSLERFDFDSVLLPFSYVMMKDPRYATEFNDLTAACAQRNVAVQTIKSIARRPWMGREHTAAPWYEPLTNQDEIDPAVHWVMQEPGVFINTVSDIDILPKMLTAAERFDRDIPRVNLERRLGRLELEPLFV